MKLSHYPFTHIGKTLFLGTVGGGVCFYLNLPLAWMLGAMIVTTVASLSGVQLDMPPRLRGAFVTILGVYLGSAFNSEILEQISRWPLSLSALVLYVGAITGILYVYFQKVLGFDRVSAFFSATPGGLGSMVIAGGALGGDERKIALVHGARVLLVVLVIPLWFRYQVPDLVTTGSGLSLADARAVDMLTLLGCALSGVWLGKLIRLPAHGLLGPMLVSAGVHISGLSNSPPPTELIAVAQVVIGCSVGARFSGVPLRQVLTIMLASCGATVLMLGTTVLFTLVISHFTGFDWQPLVLAYSPGGLVEMSMIALSLGIETAFVASHHMFRILLIVVTTPLIFSVLRSINRKRKPASCEPIVQDNGD